MCSASSLCSKRNSRHAEGYCSLDAIAQLGSVTKAECEAFVREALAPERFAISIIDFIHEAKKD